MTRVAEEAVFPLLLTSWAKPFTTFLPCFSCIYLLVTIQVWASPVSLLSLSTLYTAGTLSLCFCQCYTAPLTTNREGITQPVIQGLPNQGLPSFSVLGFTGLLHFNKLEMPFFFFPWNTVYLFSHNHIMLFLLHGMPPHPHPPPRTPHIPLSPESINCPSLKSFLLPLIRDHIVLFWVPVVLVPLFWYLPLVLLIHLFICYVFLWFTTKLLETTSYFRIEFDRTQFICVERINEWKYERESYFIIFSSKAGFELPIDIKFRNIW